MEHQKDQDSGSRSERKLMKLGDLEGHEEKEEKIENNGDKIEIELEEKSLERVCPFCDKRFSSGKALGGHVSSAHVQSKGHKAKSYSKKLKRKYNSSHAKSVVGFDDGIDEIDEFGGDGDWYYSESLIGTTEFEKKRFVFGCKYCGKEFPSKKSLFGHMRCHPDRPYRGMGPPDCNNLDHGDDYINNSSIPFHAKSEFEEFEEFQGEEEVARDQENVISGTQVVDLAQGLVGCRWFRKGIRGIGGNTNSSSATAVDTGAEKSDSIGNNEMYGDEEDSFEECRLASYLLMHLHTNGGSKSCVNYENVVAEAEAEAEAEGEAEAMSSASPSEDMEVFLDFAMSRKTRENSEQSSNEAAEKERNKAVLENGNDDDYFSDVTKSGEAVRKLDCARKGKGKMVEEKKKRKCNKSENLKEFRCNSCGKIFATHQALGGHKSSHNKFKINIHNTIDDNVLPLVMDNQNGTIQSHSRGSRICKRKKVAVAAAVEEVQKVLDFDLNQLPEEES